MQYDMDSNDLKDFRQKWFEPFMTMETIVRFF